MVETALTGRAEMRSAVRWKMSLAITVLLVLLFALFYSGQWPELRSHLSSSPKGLLAIAPSEIERMAILIDKCICLEDLRTGKDMDAAEFESGVACNHVQHFVENLFIDSERR